MKTTTQQVEVIILDDDDDAQALPPQVLITHFLTSHLPTNMVSWSPGTTHTENLLGCVSGGRRLSQGTSWNVRFVFDVLFLAFCFWYFVAGILFLVFCFWFWLG